jgi:excisionase family DNA binding protein
MKNQQQTSNLISTTMAASILGFTPDYVRHLILDGKIKAEKVGNGWIMTKKAIQHIKRQRKPAKSSMEREENGTLIGL